jgi:hypothetical protein
MISMNLRRRRFACWLSVLLVLSFATPALARQQAPSLADLARKEQERRKSSKPPPKKAYTNKDLPKSAAQPGAVAEVPAAAAVAAPEPVPAEVKPPDNEKNEVWWRARIGQAREEVRRNEVFVEALQSRVNALSADFVNRDDPYQRAKIGQDRQKALDEMERVKADLDKQRKQIADIEEEARVAGVPPGWIR